MNFELPMRRVVTESSTKISVLLWAEVYQLKAQNSGRYSCLMSTLPQSLQGRVRDGIIPTTSSEVTSRKNYEFSTSHGRQFQIPTSGKPRVIGIDIDLSDKWRIHYF